MIQRMEKGAPVTVQKAKVAPQKIQPVWDTFSDLFVLVFLSIHQTSPVFWSVTPEEPTTRIRTFGITQHLILFLIFQHVVSFPQCVFHFVSLWKQKK